MNNFKRIANHPAIKIGYFVVLVAAAAYYLYRWQDRLPELVQQVQPGWLLAALGVTLVAALVYSLIQYTIYRTLGAAVSYTTTFRIIAISQLGKYLPGKVMFVGNYYLLSREAGIGNLQVGTSFVISQALWMLTASLCALPVLTLLDPVLRYAAVLAPVGLLLLIHPRFLAWLLQLGRRLVGQSRGAAVQLPEGLETRFYLRVAFLYLINWALAGFGVWFCLRAINPLGSDILPLAVASVSLGTVVGLLALFAPVGLGIREGLGALILAPAIGADVALLGLMLLRGITVLVDLSLAVAGMAFRPQRHGF
jgi:hypothetical protein